MILLLVCVCVCVLRRAEEEEKEERNGLASEVCFSVFLGLGPLKKKADGEKYISSLLFHVAMTTTFWTSIFFFSQHNCVYNTIFYSSYVVYTRRRPIYVEFLLPFSSVCTKIMKILNI